jgi:Rrf2 family transcriptional regulator, nitric oxide-sensitive transcriptional repressor
LAQSAEASHRGGWAGRERLSRVFRRLTMRLTLYTDYCLRVLMFSGTKGEALSTISEIAEHFEISKNHLVKVVHELGQKGYLETVRGKKGGFRLMRKPSQINVGTVVRDCEEELEVIGCLQRRDYCPIQQACVLRSALQEATRAFLAVLDRYTLEDLLEPGKSLIKLLALDWPKPPSKAASSRVPRKPPQLQAQPDP